MLRGERTKSQFDTIFSEIHETRIMRSRDWMYVKHFDNRFESQLFNLLRDHGEKNNVITDPGNQTILAEMDEALTKFFNEHSKPEYDV